jgi:hypothetical protein
VAVAPLLLLALAVEVAEHEVLRALWADAVAISLPSRWTGLAAWLAPRAGPALTVDPLGLLWSATAAAFALVCLLAGLLGAGPRARGRLVAIAMAVCVAVPALVVSGIGRSTGVVRAQDAWTAQVRAGEGPVVRESWSMSFRRDPPGTLDAAPAWAPGTVLLRRLTRLAGGLDPRLFTLAAMAFALWLLRRIVARDRRPLAWAVAALSPAAAIGTVFGSPLALALAGLLGAWALLRASRPLAAAGVAAVTIAFVPVAAFALPAWLLGGRTRDDVRLAFGAAACLAAALLPGLWISNPGSAHMLAVPAALLALGLACEREAESETAASDEALRRAAG